MGKDRSDIWDGGYKRANKHGRKVYYIYKTVRGRLYEVSTRCTSSGAAESQYRRFQADPENYTPEGEAPRDALQLTGELAAGFLKWSKSVKRNTPHHLRDQKTALTKWADALAGFDLRKLQTERLVLALDNAPAQKQMIATIKTFYAWLRTVRHTVTAAEDPTFGRLKVPQSKPKQLEKVKAITLEEYRATFARLNEGWARDCLQVLAGTGWHTTELSRFAATGTVERHPRNDQHVLLCPHTKGGVPLRTQVDAPVAEAAARLRQRGAVDYFALRSALQRAGAKFNPGYLRHSVATWAINEGADPASVAAFLGHKSPATTRKFYATHSVPLKVPTMGDD